MASIDDNLGQTQGLFPNSLIDTLKPEERDVLSPVGQSIQDIATGILNQEPASATGPMTPSKTVFLDPAREAVQAGAAFEAQSVSTLKKMEAESNRIIESIDLLLDLSRETATLNADNPKLTQKIRDLVAQLKEKGINLIDLEDGKEIDKEQFAALKSTLGTHIDKLRTQIQQIFTKMQTVIQNMSSVNDSVKKMISEQSDVIRKILERSVKR